MSKKKRIQELEQKVAELEARLAAQEARPVYAPWVPQPAPSPWVSPFTYGTGDPQPSPQTSTW